ncbi:LysR family transcriptional regulator [Frigidibacter sp. ROC022]|uniref:LysR family transcriptional regulator n=1 Tax=Frigidibacter sp. ROC022 TaxID=2971796 RepID=UPI00215A44E6|nr:LysR family transcriptional regulator [Frigidibacter sp. ROC022]MCR8724029.1 LysR family transcriptional regulator [Frigidibacter sp. ROC022]
MPTTNWDEIRTAYQVARSGTVSGAAEALGVHHATVIRHIDALESRIGVKLFQRHARGYTPTEAGRDLMAVGQATDDQISQLVSRIRGRGAEVTGELVVTTVSGLSALLVPLIAKFQGQHPGLTVRFLTDARVFRLEYGEAHVAIRAGSAPEEPDNVVQPLAVLHGHLCASPAYIERHGRPVNGDFSGHRFIGHASERTAAPFYRWLSDTVPDSAVVFRASDSEAREEAVVAGLGLGFVAASTRDRYPELIEVMEPLDAWAVRLWLVTHVDLHRTTKVQAFLSFLKEATRDWPK